jgi:hypothetical protein
LTDYPLDEEPTENPSPAVIEPEIVEEPYEPVGDDLFPEDAALIDESVVFINQHVAAVVNAAIAIGEHLLTRYFNNDIELATSKNRYKKVSYKMLCDRPDLALTRPELSTMVRVAIQERFFQSIGLSTGTLNYTHKKYLTRLPDNETKTTLAAECIENDLSSRQLYQRISEIKKETGSAETDTTENLFNDHVRRISRSISQTALPDIFGNPEPSQALHRNPGSHSVERSPNGWMTWKISKPSAKP